MTTKKINIRHPALGTERDITPGGAKAALAAGWEIVGEAAPHGIWHPPAESGDPGLDQWTEISGRTPTVTRTQRDLGAASGDTEQPPAGDSTTDPHKEGPS